MSKGLTAPPSRQPYSHAATAGLTLYLRDGMRQKFARALPAGRSPVKSSIAAATIGGQPASLPG
jgi:hypothetical protein